MEHSTLKKLSEVLGISISTVSRALKDHPDISDNTKRKVRELAELMEYEPNSYAVHLRTKKSNILGILVPSINNSFYDSFIAAVEEDARLHNYTVIIMQSMDQLNLEMDNLQIFRKNMITGLFAAVTTATESIKHFRKMDEYKIPVIFFDSVPEEVDCHKVLIADERVGQIAAEALIEKKKKRVVALFGHPHLSITQKRCESFKATFKKLSPKTKLDIFYTESIEESEKKVLEVFKRKLIPDAIFCMSDQILIGTMYALHELSIKIPDEVGIIAISSGLIPTFYTPKITFVETNGYTLGKLAFAQMLSVMRGNTQSQQVFLDSKLVKGNSL
jgi:LacI family transcriptional regulator